MSAHRAPALVVQGGGAAASFAQFMASSVSPGAAAPPLLTSLTNCLSCGDLKEFYA